MGDSLRLRQILVNLLNNAIKFSSEGDVLLRAMVEHRARGDVTLRFEVCDTGIGIPQADQDRIFDPFTQVDATTTRQHGGTGLGLAIATELVRLMGGRIGVNSTLGRGSTFYFTVTLPETPELAGEETHRARPLSELAGLRVLVVDDNATNRRVLENTLRHGHLNPVLATNGLACLAALRQAVAEGNPFQVLIADALMPGMDGFTLVEQIQADPQLAKAVIMMISSADRHTFRQRCEDLGIDLYLEKPVSQAAVWEAIATATGREPATGTTAKLHAWGPTQCLRVLVAEDTVANQKIVKSILSKRGHAVEIARNGREVVEMIRHQPFDLILMDVQMPIMDGFQATSTIRSLEAHLGRRVPIIALTAHARQGDRERCLAAGMDDYLVKPVSAASLVELVEHFRPAREAADRTPPRGTDQTVHGGTDQTLHGQTDQTIREPRHAVSPAEPLAADPERRAAFDLAAALARLGDDREFFANLVEFFVEDYPKLLGEIRSSLQAQNATAVAHAAHSLKGLVGNFDAHPTVRVVSRMEKAGFDNDLATVAVLMESLEHELVRLLDALLPYRGNPSA
jgi:CheY-like chemotaxis protein